jgi:hypothetical protein
LPLTGNLIALKAMDKINEAEVAEEHRTSPKGAFEMKRKHISVGMRGGEPYWTGP